MGGGTQTGDAGTVMREIQIGELLIGKWETESLAQGDPRGVRVLFSKLASQARVAAGKKPGKSWQSLHER